MAYPIDFIRDQQRAELARQTRGILPATSAQQGMVVSDARVNQALANMFATQQKMAMAEDARLQQQAVMLQRQREQQAALEARAREAQLARDARAMEGERMRAAQMERLDKQQQFQRAMQRRSLGSGRRARRADRLEEMFSRALVSAEGAPGSHKQKVLALKNIAKKMERYDPSRAKDMREVAGSLTPAGVPYAATIRQEQGRARQRSIDEQNRTKNIFELQKLKTKVFGAQKVAIDESIRALKESGATAAAPRAQPAAQQATGTQQIGGTWALNDSERNTIEDWLRKNNTNTFRGRGGILWEYDWQGTAKRIE